MLKSELFDLQQNITLKDIFKDKNNTIEFWNTLEEHQYLIFFWVNTHICQANFSKLTFIKNKLRNRLSDTH